MPTRMTANRRSDRSMALPRMTGIGAERSTSLRETWGQQLPHTCRSRHPSVLA
jgi:hypothetical protein